MARDKLKDLEFFVVKLMNELQDEHAKLLNDLHNFSDLDAGKEIEKIATKVYKGKVEILDKIYKAINAD